MSLMDDLRSRDLRAFALRVRGQEKGKLNQADSNGWAPIHFILDSAEEDPSFWLAALTILLREGADPSLPNGDEGVSPLLMAVFRGSVAAVRLLLAAGASTSTRGAEGDTPVCWAANEGMLDILEVLLAAGAEDIDSAAGLLGLTPLGAACRNGRRETIDMLLAHGASPDALDADRRTPLENLSFCLLPPEETAEIRQLLRRRGATEARSGAGHC